MEAWLYGASASDALFAWHLTFISAKPEEKRARHAMEDQTILLSELRKTIGRDYVYVSASDPHRHFDPITIVSTYAAALFLAFVTGASSKVGEKTGEVIFDRISTLVAKL